MIRECPLHGVGGNRKHRKLDTLLIAGQTRSDNWLPVGR